MRFNHYKDLLKSSITYLFDMINHSNMFTAWIFKLNIKVINFFYFYEPTFVNICGTDDWWHFGWTEGNV